MSKQQKEVKKILCDLFSDVKEECFLQKITNNTLYPNIRVDFYIPSVNLIIEVHGIQHDKVSGFGRSKNEASLKYLEQTTRDDRLRKICKKENINYEEIWYNEKVSMSYMTMRLIKYLNGK